MKEQYEALCDCLLFQLDHPAKISGTEYLNPALNMAGTMSEKELRISCGITLGAEVKSLSRNTNASAMALLGNTVYLAKAHANENGKMVYKSMIFNNRSKNSLTIGDGMNCTFEHVCSNL